MPLPGDGRTPEFWDPLTGRISPVPYYYEKDGYTHIPMHFAPEGAVFVVFTEGGGQAGHIVRVDRSGSPLSAAQSSSPRYPQVGFEYAGTDVRATVYDPGQYTVYWSSGNISTVGTNRLPSEIAVGGEWNVRFDPAWGPKEAVTFPRLISWTESPEPLIRYYSGKAVYENGFDLDKGQIRGHKVLLDLGNVQDVAVIRVNGHEFPVSWCSPYEVDITSYVRAGHNRLSVDVVNLWPNRLIGDGKLPAGERMTRSNISKYDAPDAEKYMRVSGLLGPVRIKLFEQVKITPQDKN